MVTLYSLPSCPICEMVKTKLINKGIAFIDKDFALISETINSDHAPALQVSDDLILNTPSSIVNWINEQ